MTAAAAAAVGLAVANSLLVKQLAEMPVEVDDTGDGVAVVVVARDDLVPLRGLKMAAAVAQHVMAIVHR